MLFKAITNQFDKNERTLKKYRGIVQKINALEPEIKQLKDEDFPVKTVEFRKRIADGASLDDLLVEAFALVREAALRVIGERHYDVQLVGGMALHEGNIAEMATGEGKTLSSTCPCYLNALSGKGVHVVTPNDYLARRDSQWMGKIYQFLGLSVGVIQHGMNDKQRKENYGCDITYGTNNEYGFDYLRDNMKFDLADYVQRDFNYAIVDEVDSILVDEARTPLIISGPTEENIDKYYTINKVMFGLKREIRKEEVGHLLPDEMWGIETDKMAELEDRDVVREGDYSLDEKGKHVTLTERGSETIEGRIKSLLKPDTHLFDYDNIEILHHVNQALKAHYLFRKDTDYVVQDNKVVIVDEFTGRLMPGRRFSDGLHQALEAKEGVQIERESQTLASITFQNYFRMYDKLAGMTGTAFTEKEEFKKIYNLGVVVIPTNKPVIRKDLPDVIYKTETAKYKAITGKVKELYENGQPVLVGTVSVETSEKLSQMFHQARIPHEVLNAKHHEREAEIVSKAGEPGSVTIATNMAGRGTDIKPAKQSLEHGGLFVLGTGRHDSRRIDNQLRGRSGRQGDPGMSQFFLSLEDDLLRVFGGERISRIMDRLNIDEDEPIEHVFISKAIENAQKKVEGHHFSVRKHVLEYDDVMNRQRSIIYERRRNILSADIQEVLLEMCDDVVDELFATHCHDKHIDQWDILGFNHAYRQVFQADPPKDWQEEPHSRDQFQEMFFKLNEELYVQKYQYFKNVYKDSEGELDEEFFKKDVASLQRQILLSINDGKWKDHLLQMDHLREGIGLVGYAQKKPIDEYRKQAFAIFADLMRRISHEVVSTFFRIEVERVPREPVQPRKLPEQEMTMHHGEAEAPKPKPKATPVKKQEKVGRNDPCPCGSGKKFKQCHGKIQNATAS